MQALKLKAEAGMAMSCSPVVVGALSSTVEATPSGSTTSMDTPSAAEGGSMLHMSTTYHQAHSTQTCNMRSQRGLQ